MTNDQTKHTGTTHPEPFVSRFVGRIAAGGAVLDVAAGSGRNGLAFWNAGHHVTFVDRNTDGLTRLHGEDGVEIVQADLETDAAVFSEPGRLAGRVFDAIVVVNYLHRPLFPHLLALLHPGGLLIYSTFMRGNEAFGKPSNSDFLLQPGELLTHVGFANVIAFEEGVVVRSDGSKVMRQSIAALKRSPTTRRGSRS